MPSLTPEYIFRDVTYITTDFLHKHGIKALVLDVDNTLTGHGSQLLSEEVANWLQTIKDAGFKMMVASNNYRKRVGPFAKQIGLDYASFCCKPLPKWWLTAKRKWGLPKNEVALVGDQIFTDVLAGHSAGVKVLMVRPRDDFETTSIKFKRRLEKPFILNYFKQGGKLL